MPTPEIPPETVTNTVTTGLLGLAGAVLSLLFGGHDLTMWKRVGCLLAGVACAVVFGPLVVILWNDCPPPVLSATGFVMGLGGLFLVRGLLAAWRAMESNIPGLAGKFIKSKTGLDLGGGPAANAIPTVPAPSATPAPPPPPPGEQK